MNKNSTHLALLGITNFYEISSDYIYELREKNHRPENVFSKLPKYTINTNENANNRIIEAEYFLQFIGTYKEEKTSKYLMFDLVTNDSLLAEEISNSGYDELLKTFDFKEILSKFKPNTEEDLIHFRLSNTNYIVIELEYISSQDYETGYWDTDMNINLFGYLNDKMELVKFTEIENRQRELINNFDDIISQPICKKSIKEAETTGVKIMTEFINNSIILDILNWDDETKLSQIAINFKKPHK